MWLADEAPGHERAHIRHHVAERSIKHQSVDGLVERAGGAKGDNDEDTSYQ